MDWNRRRTVPLERTHRPPFPLRTGGERWQHVSRHPHHLQRQRRRDLGRDNHRTLPLPPQNRSLQPGHEAQAGKLPAGRQRDHGHRRSRGGEIADRHAERLPRRVRHPHEPVHRVSSHRRRGEETLRYAYPHDFPAGHEPLHDRFGQRPFFLQPQERRLVGLRRRPRRRKHLPVFPRPRGRHLDRDLFLRCELPFAPAKRNSVVLRRRPPGVARRQRREPVLRRWPGRSLDRN